MRREAIQSNQMPHVVVVGGGFGGLETAKRLEKAAVRVTIVDKHNYHLFQPLLYQVATGGLSPANIASPLRSIVRKQKNCEVLLAEMIGIDAENKQLLFADGELGYDKLVLAVGSTHSYFGNDEWQPFAPGLKTIGEATEIRRRIYVAFESAEREADPQIRAELMTFVIVGGGATGVELAGTLAEIAEHTLNREFRHINPTEARIVLVEASPSVLAVYSEKLRQCAEKKISALGIEVHANSKVTEITGEHVRLLTDGGETTIRTRTVLWGAGVKANPLGKVVASAFAIETDRIGRIPVDDHLQLEGQSDVFVIGDLALCKDKSGKPLPGLAAVAMQQGAYVAKLIQQKTTKPFVYNDRGSMATIGRAAAVAKIGKYEFCGLFAWLLWLLVHLMLIVQFQNRVLILFQWAWNYITFNRSARLIIGDEQAK